VGKEALFTRPADEVHEVKTNPSGNTKPQRRKPANSSGKRGHKRGQRSGINRPFLYVASLIIIATVLIASYQMFIRANGEETTATTTATTFDLRILERVTIEAGSSLPAAASFSRDGALSISYVTPISSINTAVPGEYPLQIKAGDTSISVILAIKDTTPPAGEPAEQEIWLGESVEAEQFVTNAHDVTTISYSFKKEPDWQKPGRQDVVIVLRDTSGNTAEIASTLIILHDDEPPVITGAVDQKVFIGDTISYRKDVTVTDNIDPDVQLEIDNSAVNLAVEGTYPVVYRAVDQSGNRTEVTVTITVAVKPEGYVSEAELYVLIDQVLAEIVKPGMTDLEILSEIFYWIADHINYTGTSDKSDWVKGAYLGITRGTGDCFNYFATAKAFLTRAGYETVPIERVQDAKTRHYWNLVYYNEAWYHFDPLPNLAKYHYVCLLRTDAEVAAYSKENPRFYEFDRADIPETPTEPLNIERKIIYG
jgi:hypothetical protein